MRARHFLPLALAPLAGIGFLPSALADAAHGIAGPGYADIAPGGASREALYGGHHGRFLATSVTLALPAARVGAPTLAGTGSRVPGGGVELYLHLPR